MVGMICKLNLEINFKLIPQDIEDILENNCIALYHQTFWLLKIVNYKPYAI